MCSLLKISRNACYYTKKEKKCDTELENEIIRILCGSRDCHGTRKIKRALGGRRKEAAVDLCSLFSFSTDKAGKPQSACPP